MKISKKMIYETMKENPDLFYIAMPEDWKKVIPVVTASILEECGLHLTLNHTGKMVGMQSLSTTCKCNSLCGKKIENAFKALGIEYNTAAGKDIRKEARAAIKKYLKENPYTTNVSICAFCFSDSQQDMQETMQQPLSRNFEILNNGIIHSDWIPVINALYFRGESFGDFASVNAVVNFFNIAEKNKYANVTAWTKNPGFFYKAIDAGYKKPENFKLILSSQFINRVARIPEKYAGIVDAVFTVFTPEYAEKFNITINCGACACLSCLRCYTNFDGSVKYVNELLK